MQYGATYIGRTFKLQRTHHEGRNTLVAGCLGVSKSVDLKSSTLLLEFKGAVEPPVRAWINENNVLLVDIETKTEQSPPAPATSPAAERSFKQLYEKGMKAVESSTIAAVGYFNPAGEDQADKGKDGGDLVVQFKNGGAYIVEGVLQATFTAILTADSPGKAYDALVKKDPALKTLVKKLRD